MSPDVTPNVAVELAAGELRAVAESNPELAARLRPALRELTNAGIAEARRSFREEDADAFVRAEQDRLSKMYRRRFDLSKQQWDEKAEAVLARRDALHEQERARLEDQRRVFAVASGVMTVVAAVGWVV